MMSFTVATEANQEEKKEEMSKTPSAEREERILAFWEKERIFQKSIDKEASKGEFVFYDGPPFATGLPHFGHLLPTTLKDLIPRYKTMQGYRVRRRWGWDCHGLPVENLVEKELGLKSKKEIEEYGIDKFNQAARASVLRYASEWCSIVPRVGRWVDMHNDYRTMDSTYTESVWWAFKSLYDKGLVYDGFKVMPYCPRCETSLANFEVNQGYKDITDISVYVKFEVVGEPNTFLLAWTTTPWTLPGNSALAVNPQEVYARVESEGATLILLNSKVEKVFEGKEYTKVGECKGEELVGKMYRPLFDYYSKEQARPLTPERSDGGQGWKVYGADFVTTEDGTGIVHIAPAFGEDDYQLSLAHKLPFIQHVTKEGLMKPEVVDFAGLRAKPKAEEKDGHQATDIEIIKWLAKENKLFKKEKIIHPYPHCWRCDTPLLNYATSSWFVRVTALKDRLIEENNKVKWVPEGVGKNRFGKWLDGARDWAVSRSRFWGAPIPVWRCLECQKIECIGSVAEIKERTKSRNRYFVMRHGQGEHNVTSTISSDHNRMYHLTEKGREDVALVGSTLKDEHIDLVYVSPLTRTRETAEIVMENIGFSGEIIEDARLREYDFGELDGKNIEDYHRYFNTVGEQLDKRLPQGENIRDVAKRVGEFIYEIDQKHDGKTILIVTHDSPASMLFAVAAGGSDNDIINFWEGDFLPTSHVKEFHFVALPHNDHYALDLHRPYIDQVKMKCECGGTLERVPEVFDCWFESGSMPFAEIHYPFGLQDRFAYPADFIAEGLDQTRGWFYTMLVLGTALFDKSPYKNVIVNGLILAEDGQKMAKSKNNFPPIMPTIEKYSADALRYFLMQSPSVKAEDVAFSERGVDEINKKILLRLQNVVSFYELYADKLTAESLQLTPSSHILDLWMEARIRQSARSMTEALDQYEIDRGVRPLTLLIDDLSTWYLRRSRDRFKSDDQSVRSEAISSLRSVLLSLSKLIAPVMPFYAEEMYQKVKGGPDAKESVHLEKWPEYETESEAEKNVLMQMKITREIVERGLSLRNSVGVKVRQPLASFTFARGEVKLPDTFLSIIADELNVKSVKEGEKDELDIVLTDALRSEGIMRELLRLLQDQRKKENWQMSDRGILRIWSNEEGNTILRTWQEEIKKVAGLSELRIEESQYPENALIEKVPFGYFLSV